MSRIALALSGGGITGWLYEIGALLALDDLLDEGFSVNDFDIYIGVSAGATVASLIANQVKPEDLFLANIYKTRPYYFERRDIFGFAWGEFFSSFRKVMKNIFPILKYYFKSKDDIYFLDLIDMLQDAQPTGFYSLEPFDKYLTSLFKTQGLSNSFKDLKKELYIPATDLDTGRYTVFGEGDDTDVNISKSIIASSAAPVYFCPVTIKGRDYVDGGVGRISLFDIAIDKKAEFTLIINPVVHLINDKTVACIPSISGYCAGVKDKGFSVIAGQSMNINTESRFYFSMKRYQNQYPNMDFYMIAPKPTDTFLFLQSFLSIKARIEIMRYGYLSCAERLESDFEKLKKKFEKFNIRISLEKLSEKVKERRKLINHD